MGGIVTMRRRIGEIFDCDGVELQVVEDVNNDCSGCYFTSNPISCDDEPFYSIRGWCNVNDRGIDSVIFKKVSDVVAATEKISQKDSPELTWIKYSDKKPETGIEVIAYNSKWVNKDFNPNGMRVGFVNGNGEFTSAYKWDYQDCYETINLSNCSKNGCFYNEPTGNTEPEFWTYFPKPPRHD